MIFEHSDYRNYLNNYLKSLPKQGHGEAKKIASYLRVTSTFVSQVLSGKKLLSPEQANLLAEYLGLSEVESEYFFYLVQKERAGTEKLKKFCISKLNAIKEKSLNLASRLEPKRVLTENEKAAFYSSPLYSAVHLFISTEKNGRSIDDITQRFDISRAKAQDFIRFFSNANLVEENGTRYLTTTQSTHLERNSPHLAKHHSNWRIKAIQQFDQLTEKELMYTANVSLSEKDFEVLREKMVVFIKSFLSTVHASPSEDIACLNLDWFWIKK